MNENVSVIGLGYVGLPLALSAAESGYKVLGLDINQERVKTINMGKSPIEDIADLQIVNVVKDGSFFASSDFSLLSSSKIILITVPTPLSEIGEPDLDFITNAIDLFSPYVAKGSLIILESTVAPGFTRDVFIPMVLSKTKLNENELDFGFSPERIDPGNNLWNLRTTPKIISASSERSLNDVYEFYSKFVEVLHRVKCFEVAETAKLLENSFRLVNISLANELMVFCDALGIEVNEVIMAASSKPYGFMPFYPGVGVGGHCIPVDPMYLAHKANEIGTPIKLINLSSSINLNLPMYFVKKVSKILGDLKDRKILVIGVAYKPNIGDTRETPVKNLILELRKRGAQVSWHDELVKNWNGEESVPLENKFDLAIVATRHDYMNLTVLGSMPVIDSRRSTL